MATALTEDKALTNKQDRVTILTMGSNSESIYRNSLIVSLHSDGVNQAEIGRQFGISRERIRQILKRDLGNSTPVYRRESVQDCIAIEALKVINNDGNYDEFVKTQNVKRSWVDRLIFVRTGVTRVEHEFLAWAQEMIGTVYGQWLILSISRDNNNSRSKTRCKAEALCLVCGGRFAPGMRNIINGTSQMCHSCSCKNRYAGKPVIHLRTGNLYGSITEAADSLGLSYSKAKQLADSGSVLVFVKPSSVR